MAADLASALTRTVDHLASAIESWERAVRDDVDDSVHRMRVSTRTLRSVLQVYAPLFEPTAAAEAGRALRRLGRRLSATRDAEVVLGLLEERLLELPPEASDLLRHKAIQRLRRRAATEHDRALARLHPALDSPPHREDRLLITDFARDVPLASGPVTGDEVAATLAPFVLQRMATVDAMTKGAIAADAKGRVELLHETRKEAKRVRYAITAVRDATDLDLGPEVSDRRLAATQVHRALGDHRDSVMLGDFLLRAARRARGRGEDTFAHGLLYGRELSVQDDALQAVRQSVTAAPAIER